MFDRKQNRKRNLVSLASEFSRETKNAPKSENHF